jgi:hypothetical protein
MQSYLCKELFARAADERHSQALGFPRPLSE